MAIPTEYVLTSITINATVGTNGTHTAIVLGGHTEDLSGNISHVSDIHWDSPVHPLDTRKARDLVIKHLDDDGSLFMNWSNVEDDELGAISNCLEQLSYV